MDSCAPTSPGDSLLPPEDREPTLQPQFSSAWPRLLLVSSWVLLECSEQAGPGKETSWWRTPDACTEVYRIWRIPHLRSHHQHPLPQVECLQTAIQPVDVAPGAGAAGDTDPCPASRLLGSSCSVSGTAGLQVCSHNSSLLVGQETSSRQF